MAIGGVNNSQGNQAGIKPLGNINLEDINEVFETTKKEELRTTFSETFTTISIEESEQAQQFLSGLINNKDYLCEKLNIEEEQYDAFACIALALASQETGMSKEEKNEEAADSWKNPGYEEENHGWGKLKNDAMKFADVILGGGSSSSGLTQIKINDFMRTLPEEEAQLLKDLGVKTWGMNQNNLYEKPEVAAAATIVILNSIAQNYDDYIAKLKNDKENGHDAIGESLPSNLSEEEKNNIGEEKLDLITLIYEKAPSNEAKEEIRNAFKDWFKAYDDTLIGGKGTGEGLNEEENLNVLNEKLKACFTQEELESGAFEELKKEDIDYIRYFLTSEGQEMNMLEYCAYAWNKGTSEDGGMKVDRTIIDKIGTILKDPECFDYDQFTVNVVTLAEKYASQSNPELTIDEMVEIFDEYEFN